MVDITNQIYSRNFDKIVDWFYLNVHVDLEEYDYEIID
jgi:hypothetical protein